MFTRWRDPVYMTRGMVMVGSTIEELNPDTMSMAMTRGLATTYVRLAQFGSMEDLTKQALGLEILPEYSIIGVPDSQLIQVTVTDTDPQRAQIVATELINQLIAMGPGGTERQQRENFAADQLTKLQEGIAQSEATIAGLQEELATALSARQIRQIEEKVAAQEGKLTTLRANYVALVQTTDQGASNTIRVVDAPTVPQYPVESNDAILILLAGFLGAGMAVAGAYALDFLDDRLRDVGDISREFGLPTLGVIPESTLEQLRGPLIVQNEPHSIAAESFRVLRTNMLFASVDKELKILHITSPGPGDGKSYVSSNLSIAFAHAAKRVILIDADLRKPTLHRVFGILNNKGVSTALLGGKVGLQEAIQPTTVPGLSVMTSGPLPPNPSELLTSNRMQEMLAKLSSIFDLVVVDSPPATVVSDSAVLASRSDGVLLVLPADDLGRERVRNALGAMGAVNANVLGVALNRSSSSTLGFYYSYKTDYSNKYYRSHYLKERTSAPANGHVSLKPALEQADFMVNESSNGHKQFDLKEENAKEPRARSNKPGERMGGETPQESEVPAG